VTRGTVIDDAIDRAVREMVQVDPPAGLRRRVESRLTAPGVQRGARMRYLAAAATLGALLLAATLVVRHDSPSQEGIGPASVPAVPPQQAIGTPKAERPAETRPAPLPDSNAQVSRTTPPARGRRVPHTEAIPMPEITNVFGTAGGMVAGASVSERESDSGLPPVDTVPAGAIEFTVLSIAPLTLEPLRVPPIPDARKRR
jgi:hypothetical protein